MSNLALNPNLLGDEASELNALIEGWLKREQDGEQFPVNFDAAWQLAGYSTKGNAKRKLIGKKSMLIDGQDYKTDSSSKFIRSDKSELSGRSSDLILLTCDAFKQFCLMAETEQGRNIRQYFIECEKRWRLVQQYHPEVAAQVDAKAQDMEMLRLQNENLKLQVQATRAQQKLMEFRHTVVTTCPEVVQQKVLGFEVVEKVEYRDRVIKDDEVINDGNSVGKGELCRRYGFLTKSGSPDYKRLNAYLKSADLPAEAWKEVGYVRNNEELDRSYLPQLDRIIFDKSDRQLWLVE